MEQIVFHEYGLDAAIERLQRINRGIPWFLRYVGRQIVQTCKREAVANASNVVIRRRTGALVGHINKQQPKYEPGAVTWGLPKGDLQSRIGRALNDGQENITSRTGRFLRIPIPGGPADQGAGVDPYAGVPLRGVPGFFVAKSEAGNPIIFRLGGGSPAKGAMFNVVPWYFLKQSITIPPHPWFSNAVTTTKSLVRVIIESRLHALEQAHGGAEGAEA